MSWARVDDGLHAHPKIRRAWKCRPALGLHLMALSYCGRWGGELGLVPDEFVEEKLPNARERRQVTEALVDAGLWDAAEGGWLIHDWPEYNHAAQAGAEKARKAAKARWEGCSSITAGDAQAHAQALPGQSVSNAPRGGARSPAPGRGAGSSTATIEDQVDARKPARKPPDQAIPDPSMPVGLLPAAEHVLSVLAAVQGERGGQEPSMRGVSLVVADFPDHDHSGIVGALRHWALAGPGAQQATSDWPRRYRAFCKREAPGISPRRAAQAGPATVPSVIEQWRDRGPEFEQRRADRQGPPTTEAA